MKLIPEELRKYLTILEINATEVTLKEVSSAFQRLALIRHPDKVGDKSTAAFVELREAYEKLRDPLKLSSDNLNEINFFEDNFKNFNFPFEHKGGLLSKLKILGRYLEHMYQ